jgi:RHS repeat-associated protein
MKKNFLIAVFACITHLVMAQCPASFFVTGGGTYCTGTTPGALGVNVTTSDAIYKLYRDGIMVDQRSGTGGSLSFGVFSTAGAYTVKASRNGCDLNGSNTATIAYVSSVGQVSSPAGPTTRCVGSGTNTYTASASNATSYTWSFSPAAAGTINTSTGTVTWNSTYTGNVTITVTAFGCSTTSTATTTVSVSPLVGTVSAPSGTTSRCIGAGTSAYTATASNATSYSWSVTPSAAGTISSAGVVTWSSTFSGTATVTVTAGGCNSSTSTASTNVTVNPNVGQVSAPSGTTTRCIGSGTTTYTASATNATSYSWSISPSTAGTISAGVVTWSSTFSGAATISVTASGCNSSTSTASTSVTVSPNVGQVSNPSGTTTRCFGAGTSSYTASASNATGYSWSISPSTAGTISTAGVVTWSATFTGTATITVTASGCSPTNASTNVTVLGTLAQVSNPSGPTSRCSGAGSASYTASAANAQSYTWSISPSTAGTISATGTVTWASTYTGSATVTVVANGCNSATTTGSTTVSITPGLGQVSTPSGPSPVCALAGTSTYTASASNATSYSWSLSPTTAGTITSAGVATWSTTYSGSVTVTVIANGCGGATSTASQAVTINASPTAYNVTAPTTVCSNTTVTVGLSGSQSGVNYQLYKNNVATGAAKAGTGSALSWTGMGAGTYKVLASNASCTNALMTNQPVVTLVGPTSAAITGPTKVDADPITLSATTGTGFTYVWKRDGTVLAGKTAATLSTSDAGNYEVVISNAGCSLTSQPYYVTKAVKRYYNGIISSTRWRTDKAYGVTGSDFTGMYTFDYDSKYQIKGAEWKTPNFTTNTFTGAGNVFRLADMSYDANGNIYSLKRFDNAGAVQHNFAYTYQPNKNKLASVSNYVSAYTYDALGRMTSADKAGTTNDQFFEYDVTGKVTAVYSDAAKQKKVVKYLYDDRGFRLAKIGYNGTDSVTSWYIRDASGNIISMFQQDSTGIYEKEIPIYGAGKLGTYESTPAKRNFGSVNYELTDHLGNVRAIIRDNANVYVATMEDNGIADISNPRVSELAFFENIPATVQQDAFMNVSTPIPTVVPNPNKVAYLFWNDNIGTQASDKAVGPSIALKVKAGDKVQVETWARYEKKTSYAKDLALTALSSVLGTSFSRLPAGGGFEGQTPSTVSTNVFNALTAKGFDTNDNSTGTPFAYVNYILYNSSMVMVDAGWKRVPLAAGSDPAELNLPQNKPIKVALDAAVNIANDGFIYVWVSNQSKATRVWFDDLTVSHQESMVIQASDYGVWGDVIREQKTGPEKYRFGYQGQYAEKDDETGWSHFELREYDAVTGRWTATDPYTQFWSPYIGMGNEPVSGTDPDGGKCKTCPDGAAYDDYRNSNLDYAFSELSSGDGVYQMLPELTVMSEAGVKFQNTINAGRNEFMKEFTNYMSMIPGGQVFWISSMINDIEDGNGEAVAMSLALRFLKIPKATQSLGALKTTLPGWKKVTVDMAHVASGHIKGGSRVSKLKSLFADGMTSQQVLSMVVKAYRNVHTKLQTQGDRVLLRGDADGTTIEMWLNTVTKTIETAYPVN